MISEIEFDNLQKSATKVAENINPIIEQSFSILFENHPELKEKFKAAKPTFVRDFSGSVLALASYIEHEHKMQQFAKRFEAMLAQSKIDLDVVPPLTDSVLKGIKKVLGLKAPPKAIEAWEASFAYLNESFLVR